MLSNINNTKAMGLIFLLFDVTSACEVIFGLSQYVCILHRLTSVLLSVPFIFVDRESVDLVVALDGFFYATEIIHIFYSGYFDYRGAFCAVLDLYCCVMG